MKWQIIVASFILTLIIIYAITIHNAGQISQGGRFTKFHWEQLLKYIDWDKTINLDYLR